MPPKRKAVAQGGVASKKMKLNVPVDEHCPFKGSHHVYIDPSDGKPWCCTTNQVNIGNNNNKFYILQLLENNKGGDYKMWARWGRVGVPGQQKVFAQGGLDACKSSFCKKFQDKTRNNWDQRDNFTKVHGKYDLVEIDYECSAEEAQELESALNQAAAAAADTPKQSSKLKPAVQRLMELIFNIKEMTATIVAMKYDVKKLPLGKLSSAQIKAGYEALSRIEQAIKAGKSPIEATNDFYTRIPHVFGMKTPPVIRDMDTVKEKTLLLDALTDIKIAYAAVTDAQQDTSSEPKVDLNYKSLNIDLQPLAATSDEYKMVAKYLSNTHGHTHTAYKLELEDVFVVDKDLPFKGKNKMLLWHGSRLTNWVGILSQGLRIAPPEAPVTGYMFGKGVYFADMVTKSANYCFTSRDKNTGLLLLCEVALDDQFETLQSDCHLPKTLPKGKVSTYGRGKTMPDPKQNIKMGDVTVPLGSPLLDCGVRNPSGFTLQYNEFIVYDTSKIRFKYLLRVKFNYGK